MLYILPCLIKFLFSRCLREELNKNASYEDFDSYFGLHYWILFFILFSGSIYEMFGNECCLSTGEVIKITDLKIKKIMAEICEHVEGCVSPQSFELPMNFPGTYFATISHL